MATIGENRIAKGAAMGFFSKFEGHMEDTFEDVAGKMFDSPISPVQIAKKAEKAMRREKMVGAGKQYAPTLYTVLVNYEDDQRLFGYYPTLAGETETYLAAKAVDHGLVMDGQPLVRFIADESLKRGKFDIIAELVAAPVIAQLRAEEMERYGLSPVRASSGASAQPYAYAANDGAAPPYGNAPQAQRGPSSYPYQYDDPHNPETHDNRMDPLEPELPYVPEDEIDYSIDYGEYTFNSEDFVNHSSRMEQGYDDAAYNPAYSDPAAAGSSPGARSMPNAPYGEVPRAASNAAVAATQFAPDSVAAYAPLGAAPVPVAAPNTVVFTPGAGNANPLPNNAAVRARLLNTYDNRVYDLATNRVMMGRDRKNDIVIDDINASRAHAELRFEQQGVWAVHDLGSTNGTLVNGNEVRSQILKDGDQITIGMTNLVLMLS